MKAAHWRFVLPLSQFILAVLLWLYMPIQFKKEILRLQHLPTAHPFRYRIPVAPEMKQYLFPPLCGRVLYVINLPADALRRRVVDPVLSHIEARRQQAEPQWEFTVPVSDPEAIEPRQIFYALKEGDIVFFGGVILLWYYVGLWVDELVQRRREMNVPRQRVVRTLELAIVASTAALLAADCITRIIAYGNTAGTPYEAIRASGLLIAEFGLIWPAALLICCYLGMRLDAQSATDSKSTRPMQKRIFG